MIELARAGSPVLWRLWGAHAPRSLLELRQWIGERVAYDPDPEGVELVRAPWETLRAGRGDCDCLATLAASGALALGLPARYVTVGRAAWEHIYAEAPTDGGEWIDFDYARDAEGLPPGGGLPRRRAWPLFYGGA